MEKKFYDIMTGVFGGKESLLQLLEKGVDIDARDGKGKTALMYVCQFGDLLTARILINSGADVNAKDMMGRTALMNICMSYGYKYACDYILSSKFIIQAYRRGSTIREYLRKTVECRRVFMADYLIKAGASIDESDVFEKTTLMYACEYGDLDLVTCLLQFKARVSDRDRNGKTALIHACSHFGGKDVGLVKHLLAKGANVNESDYWGVTPLVSASKFDNIDIIEYLIGRGAMVDKRTNAGKTALMYACKYGNFGAMRVLVNNNANINASDEIGKTVLMQLVDSFYDKKLEAVRYVVEHGARVNDMDIYGRTALVYACEYRGTDVVQYLLDRGAYINVPVANGRSLLSYAFVYVHPQVVRLLVENDINMKLEDESTELNMFLRREAEDELNGAFERKEISKGIPKLLLRVYHETQGIEALLSKIYTRVDSAWHVDAVARNECSRWGIFSDDNIVRIVDMVTKFSIKNRILEKTQGMLRGDIRKIKQLCEDICSKTDDRLETNDVPREVILERIEPNRNMLATIKKEKDKLLGRNADTIKDMLICAKNLGRGK